MRSPFDRSRQRRALDQRTKALTAAASPPPPSGWARAARESLGLTAEQVGRRIGCSKVTVVQMEKREASGKVTLEVLERAARAMGCRLVYGIVPAEAGSFEEMVDAQALRCARRLMEQTAHSMQLEQQGVDARETEEQVLELARSLKDKVRSPLWDEP